jgi:hypothetical protein
MPFYLNFNTLKDKSRDENHLLIIIPDFYELLFNNKTAHLYLFISLNFYHVNAFFVECD